MSGMHSLWTLRDQGKARNLDWTGHFREIKRDGLTPISKPLWRRTLEDLTFSQGAKAVLLIEL